MANIKNVIDDKLARFVLVGIFNTVVGAGMMFALYNLAGWSYWLSSAFNYTLTSIMSYVLNKKFTFQHDGDVAGSAVRFAANIAVCYLVAYGVAKPLVKLMLSGAAVTLRENIALLVGMVLFTGMNYLGQRFFAFKK